MLNYEVENGVQFTLRHSWEVLQKCEKWNNVEVPNFDESVWVGSVSKRYKLSGSSSFNPESGNASINLNSDARDNKEYKVQE